MKQILALTLILVLASCAVVDRFRGRPDEVAAAPVSNFPGAAAAQSADALDGTTDAQKSAALSAGGAGGASLGTVTVSLGAPTEQGFWLRSSLVTTPTKGRVVTDQGASIAVDLLPGGGAAQLSLPAFRALGLPLTGLPLVTVYSG